MPHKFAARSGKSELYKFRPYKSQQHKQWVREIIQDHKIYFSRPSQLNDPMDMAPLLCFDRSKGEAALRERLMSNAKAVWAREEPELTAAQVNERLARLAVRDLDEYERVTRDTARNRFEQQASVFSLAGNRSHPMLWSHYAEGHSGLCIHFTSSEASVFGTAMEVEYVDSRPHICFPFEDEGQDLLMKGALTKGVFWIYENEYRLLKYTDGVFVGLLEFQGQHASYPGQHLCGLTVGMTMAEAEVREILALAAPTNLPVWRAKRTLTYDVGFERIA